MVVVADTSPLNYLALIECAGILPELYGRIAIPPAVLQELRHPNTPRAVALWLASRPDWLIVAQAIPPLPGSAAGLDAGECEAIALAIANQPGVLLLIDEESGREEATLRGIRTTGTLGVLDAAAERGLLELPEALDRLLATNFHVSSRLVRLLLDRDSRRPKPGRRT